MVKKRKQTPSEVIRLKEATTFRYSPGFKLPPLKRGKLPPPPSPPFRETFRGPPSSTVGLKKAIVIFDDTGFPIIKNVRADGTSFCIKRPHGSKINKVVPCPLREDNKPSMFFAEKKKKR